MFTGLTDLIHQLQDFSTQNPSDEARVWVVVTSPAHDPEQFQIEAIHQDGPALVLECQPSQQEAAPPPDQAPHHPARTTRACCHNDYEDLA
jgi:hypothetical protein